MPRKKQPTRLIAEKTPAAPVYLLDACALIAYLSNEAGADRVERRLNESMTGSITLHMHHVNVLEVYYELLRRYPDRAESLFELLDRARVKLIAPLPLKSVRRAGEFKSTYRLSSADSILLAEAERLHAVVLTSDHHELDPIEAPEALRLEWIR